MRKYILIVLFGLVGGLCLGGEAPTKPPKGGSDAGNSDEEGQDDTSSGDEQSAKKNRQNPRHGKRRAAKAAAVAENKRIPSTIAEKNSTQVEAWKESRKQLRADLNEIYNRNPDKRADKASRINKAVAVFEALTNIGMRPPQAIGLLSVMAQTRDKDNTCDLLVRSISEAVTAEVPPAKIVENVDRIVRSSSNAAAIETAMAKWLQANAGTAEEGAKGTADKPVAPASGEKKDDATEKGKTAEDTPPPPPQN